MRDFGSLILAVIIAIFIFMILGAFTLGLVALIEKPSCYGKYSSFPQVSYSLFGGCKIGGVPEELFTQEYMQNITLHNQ